MQTNRRLPMVASLSFSMFALMLLAAALPAAAASKKYVLPGDAVYPEGIAYQQSTGDFFVSSTGDGTIFRANVADSAASVFSPGGADGRTFAAGMKVDSQGHLFVSGGNSGKMYVYDVASAALLGSWTSSRTPTFINDVTVTPSGAYFTDSQSPVLYHVWWADNTWQFEEWIDFTGTALQYQQGFNLNGIASSEDGAWLVVIQSNTGKLFRINVATKEVSEINIGNEEVTMGDGIFVVGNTLYVARNALELIVVLELAPDWSSARVVSAFTDVDFQYPTTIAVTGGTLLAVNSQFDKRNQQAAPELPFNVVAVHIPGAAGTTPGMPRTGAEEGFWLLTLAVLALGAASVAGGIWVRRRA